MLLILFSRHLCAILANPFLKGSIATIFFLGYFLERKNRFSPTPDPISMIVFLFLIKKSLSIFFVFFRKFRLFFLKEKDF